MKYLLSVIFTLILYCNFLFGQEKDSAVYSLLDKSIEELIDQEITIATKSGQRLSQTPAVVSVITSNDIKNMGARDLQDILQTIPGFDLSRSYAGYYTIGVRGVKNARIFSKLLIMIDGIPFNQIFYGNYVNWGYVINLDAVERIEIIRGTGSALYGRNAFSAVINIITKKGDYDEKLLLKGALGNYKTHNISGYYGFHEDKLKVSVALRKLYTDVTGAKYIDDTGVESRLNLFCDNIWTNTNISYGDFTLSGMYLNLKGGAVVQESKIFNKMGNYSLSYNKQFTSKISLKAKLFGHNSGYTEDIEELKPGIHPDYPEGIYYKPHSEQYLYGLETEVNYKWEKNNHVLFGVQGDLHGVYNVHILSNIDFATYSAIPGISKDNMVLYEPGWFENNEHHYHNLAFFLQDIWYPFKTIGITIGGRYDIDSEIGGQLNPRLGLVIEPVKNGDIKLLYGRAYRAPAPADQYVTLGYAIGNKALKPEIINTMELVLAYNTKNMSHMLSLYRNKLRDMIYAAQIISIDPSNKYYNIGENLSTGIEYETRYILGRNFYSYLNYSYSKSKNTDIVEGADSSYLHPDIAPHKLNMGVNYLFLKYFKMNVNMFYRSEMEKYRILATGEEVQNRIGNYAIFNSTFQIDNLIKYTNLSISLYNIFNTKYYSQDSQHLKQPPQAGRQIVGTLSVIIK